MSQYIIKLNNDDVIVRQDVDLASTYCDIVFKIKQDGVNTLDLRGVSFGFTLKKDGTTVHDYSYPPSGVKLLRSNMPYICAERVNWTPNEYYTISFWIKQSGKEDITRIYDFLTTKGDRPSKSCVWNNGKKIWEYPKSLPIDDRMHVWDERSRSWKPRRKYLSSLYVRGG
jgi:hypothetical protein